MRNGIISYRVAFTQAKNSIPPARLIKNVLNAKWYNNRKNGDCVPVFIADGSECGGFQIRRDVYNRVFQSRNEILVLHLRTRSQGRLFFVNFAVPVYVQERIRSEGVRIHKQHEKIFLRRNHYIKIVQLRMPGLLKSQELVKRSGDSAGAALLQRVTDIGRTYLRGNRLCENREIFMPGFKTSGVTLHRLIDGVQISSGSACTAVNFLTIL